MPRVTLPNSTYLDLTSYHTTTATTVAEAYGIEGAPVPSNMTLNVALVLPRANDPTALLQGNWATRQTALQQLEDNGTLWSTYGADPAAYAAAQAELTALGIRLLGNAAGSDGYISSVESRTIWVQLTPQHFTDLFGKTLYGAGPFLQYWEVICRCPTRSGRPASGSTASRCGGPIPARPAISPAAPPSIRTAH